MRRLAILIEAGTTHDAQDALDDVVAAVARGQNEGDIQDERGRIRFRWEDVPEQS